MSFSILTIHISKFSTAANNIHHIISNCMHMQTYLIVACIKIYFHIEVEEATVLYVGRVRDANHP